MRRLVSRSIDSREAQVVRKWFPVLILLVAVVLPTRAWSSTRHGDIHLQSGEILSGVDFQVHHKVRVVTVKSEQGDRNFSYTEIAAIFEDGKDVTAELLGMSSTEEPQETHEAPQETSSRWISKNSPEYRKAHSAIFKGLLAVSGLYSVSGGDYFEGIKGDIGFDATGVIPLNHFIALRFSGAKLGQQWDDKYYLVSMDPSVEITSQSIEFGSWRFSGAVQFYKHFDEQRRSASMFYGFTGLGVWTGKLTADLSLSTNGGPSVPESSSDNQTKFMWNFGGGVLGMLNDTIGVNACVEGDLLVVGTEDSNNVFEPYGSVQYATNFDFELGIVVLFH